ncbi:hypothetical protein K1719_027118 [Acacia pycnantha]|nr:hypothetical protein K1719_027118 [Acacia pycnantha]
MDLLSPTYLLFLFLIFLLFEFLRKSPERGFRKYPLLGTLPDFLKHRERFLDWTTEVLLDCPNNTSVFFRPGKIRGIITANPDNVEHMLKTNFPTTPKANESLASSKISSAPESSTPTANSGSFRGKPPDILERFAFDNICKLAFNYDPECLGGEGTGGTEFMSAFEDAATLSAGRFQYALPGGFKIKRWLNVGSERRLREAIITVHKFADEIIRSRLEARETNQDPDLLSRFIGTEESSPEFLRDIVISFIIAGRDTTSAALSWFFWILSSRPDVRQEIRDELRAIRCRNGKNRGEAFGYDELKEMNYIQAAISETMRLYPPVPVDTKLCLNDDVLPDGTVIRKDWFISYHTYAMGRTESVWGKDCCEFKPERWIENGVYRGENPFRYPVFHAGPRMCLGKELAYIQMKCIAASVMELFEIEAQNKDKCPQHVLSLTLRMKGGFPVQMWAAEWAR